MLKLKLQYVNRMIQRANSLEQTLMLGNIEGKRRRRWQRMRWWDGITYSVDMNLSKPPEIVKDREAWHATVHGIAESGELCPVTEQRLVNSPLNVTVEPSFSFSMQIHFELF